MPTIFSSDPQEYLAERSRFIGQAFHISAGSDLPLYLEDVQHRYPGASHYTWAYHIDPTDVRASDHGEPHGTAGMPILNLLSRAGWTETLVIVARYFGGTKLGRGGLVHAYQKSAQLALDSATPGERRIIRQTLISIEYKDYDRLTHALATQLLEQSAEFFQDVHLTLTMDAGNWPRVEETLNRESFGRWLMIHTDESSQIMPLRAETDSRIPPIV